MGCADLLKQTPVAAAQPTPAFLFKRGDKVRVSRKAATRSDGWNNSWTSEMDKAVGKTGVVFSVIPKDKDVTVEIPGISLFGYPAFVLEPVIDVPAVEPVTPGLKFTAGQRVKTRVGDVGTVESFDGEFFRVKMDNGLGTLRWYADSLTLIPVQKPVQTTTVVTEKLPSLLTVGTRVQVNHSSSWDGIGVIDRIASPTNYVVRFDRKGFFDIGGFNPKYLTALPSTPVAAPFNPTAVPPTAISRRSQALSIARNFAVQSARENVTRRVTIDTVQAELEARGFKSTELGNSAGVVFKGGQFRDTGLTVKSNRPGNRGRRVIIWEYVS